MTYSIVARDPATGELGVAVQSRAFGTGAACAWALPGVGAVATQAFAERGYGPRGLELLAAGRAPADAMAELLAADEPRWHETFDRYERLGYLPPGTVARL